MYYENCAFTGHRDLGSDFDEALLYRVTEDLIKTGTEKFLCGMARGFDLKAAECVIEMKKKYSVKLIACIPCSGQELRYSSADRERYKNILSLCDEKNVLGDGYFRGCMNIRDRFMVDNCNVLVSYLRKSYGGTRYTVSYAKNKGIKVIEI